MNLEKTHWAVRKSQIFLSFLRWRVFLNWARRRQLQLLRKIGLTVVGSTGTQEMGSTILRRWLLEEA